MPTRLAVDIALLPPSDVTNQIIALTAHLPDNPTRLNTTDCLPHITLAMGLLDEEKLPAATAALRQLNVGIDGIPITIHHTNTYKWQGSPLEPFSELVVDVTPKLTQLHTEVMRAFKQLLAYDNVDTSHFFSPPTVATQSIYWVEHYAEQHQSPGDYHAHITLGEGVVNDLEQSIRYTGSRLALCHLGTYCTCRKVLAEA